MASWLANGVDSVITSDFVASGADMSPALWFKAMIKA